MIETHETNSSGDPTIVDLAFTRLAPDYPSLAALLEDLGARHVISLAAPYPSDHARTLILARDDEPPQHEPEWYEAPRRISRALGLGASAQPQYVIKIARDGTNEAYMQAAQLAAERLPRRSGRLQLALSEWHGRIAGRAASAEPYIGGAAMARGALGELLREWLGALREWDAQLIDFACDDFGPVQADTFLSAQKFAQPLRTLIASHTAWFSEAGFFCHGDLVRANVLARGMELCIIDWDFCRRAALRHFDGFHALLSAALENRTRGKAGAQQRDYRQLLNRFSVLLERHGAPLEFNGAAEAALSLILVYLAWRSETKQAAAGLPPGSVFLEMLRARWS